MQWTIPHKEKFWVSLGKFCHKYDSGVIAWPCLLYTPANWHSNGKRALWRCISYWTWGYSIAMFVYRGVTWFSGAPRFIRWLKLVSEEARSSQWSHLWRCVLKGVTCYLRLPMVPMTCWKTTEREFTTTAQMPEAQFFRLWFDMTDMKYDK